MEEGFVYNAELFIFSDSFWLECTCVDGNHMNGDVEQTKEGF